MLCRGSLRSAAFGAPAPCGRNAERLRAFAAGRRQCLAPRARGGTVRVPCARASLVDAAWLAAALDADEPPAVLDVRGRVRKAARRDASGFQAVEYVACDDEYYGGHIPGATFLDWRGIRTHPIGDFVDDMEERGITQGRDVCVYDHGSMLFATKAWYSLLAAGCDPARVHVLQGGKAAWDEAEYEDSLDTSCPLKAYAPFYENEPSQGEVDACSIGMAVTADTLRERVAGAGEGQSRSWVLIDARSESQYKGEERRGRRGGHIPTAVCAPYRRLLNEDGIGFLPRDKLCEALCTMGIVQRSGAVDEVSLVDDERFVAYCNGGVASTAVLFSLARCGVPLDRLLQYDGSMNEWAELDDSYPLEATS